MPTQLPEGFTLDQGDQAIQSGLPEGFSVDQPQASADFVPTEEALAATARPEQQQDRTIGETLIGAGETALTAVTGATAGAAGYIGGAIGGLIGEATGELETGEGRLEAERAAAELTYQPRTEAGKEFTEELAGALEFLPPALNAGPGSIISSLKGMNVKASMIRKPSVKKRVIAEEIKKGNPNIDIVTKELNEMGEVVTNKASKKALKDLGGDDAATATVSVIESMNDASKAKVNKMLDLIDKGKKNPVFGDTNRPSDILGDSIASRAKTVSSINRKAGKRIGDVAKSLKSKNVDISNPRDKFSNSLKDLGVTFKTGEDGFVTPDFSRSKFIGGSQKDMNVLVNDLLSGELDFQSAHKLKRTIRDNLDYDKFGTSQVKGQSEKLLKDLSRGIDDILDSTSSEYKKANESFAKTIELKNEFDAMTGKDIDLFGDMSGKALGSKARRLASNAESRVKIQQTLMDADSVLGEFGIKFKDDIPSLTHIVNKLEDTFKIAPARSLQAQVGKGVGNIPTSQIGVATKAFDATIGKVIEKVRGPEYDRKMKALRSLARKK